MLVLDPLGNARSSVDIMTDANRANAACIGFRHTSDSIARFIVGLAATTLFYDATVRIGSERLAPVPGVFTAQRLSELANHHMLSSNRLREPNVLAPLVRTIDHRSRFETPCDNTRRVENSLLETEECL